MLSDALSLHFQATGAIMAASPWTKRKMYDLVESEEPDPAKLRRLTDIVGQFPVDEVARIAGTVSKSDMMSRLILRAADAEAAQAVRQAGMDQLATLPERLKSPLPTPLETATNNTSTPSTVPALKYWPPERVEHWVHETPEDTTTAHLTETIVAFQAAPPFPNALMPKIPSNLWVSADNEAGVRACWSSIEGSYSTVPLPTGAGWSVETTDQLIQGAATLSLPATLQGFITQPHPPAAAGTQMMRQDMVLSVRLPGGGRRAVCIAELKGPHKLQDQGQPAHLVDHCQAPQLEQEPASLPHTVGAVHQLYTYMAANCVLYGFISTWRYTWLARLVPTQMVVRPWCGKLYLSAPISSSAGHTDAELQPTAIGGVAWLKHQAMCNQLPLPSTWNTTPQPPGPPRPPSPPPDSGDGGRPPAPSGRAGRPNYCQLAGVQPGGFSDDSQDHAYIPGDSLRTHPAPGETSIVWVTRDQPPDSKQVAVSSMAFSLQLEEHLCDGCHGPVFRGTVSGAPAVIKLLGPGAEGTAAFHREWEALRYLAEAKVGATPQLLGVGHLYLGVHFLATALVQGQPLSVVRPLTPEVAAAARHALAQVHAAHPGLLHGDVRLQNILLVTSSSSSGSGSGSSTLPLECRVVDFGASSWSGSPAGQGQELRLLQQLLEQAS